MVGTIMYERIFMDLKVIYVPCLLIPPDTYLYSVVFVFLCH